MAVIAAGELDDLVAPGRRPRDAHRAHRRFGSRADEPDPLHRRHQHGDALGKARFEFGGAPKLVPRARRCRQRLQQPSGRVAVNQRAPGHHVVDVGVAVDILELRAASAHDEQRRRADRFERAHRAVDAARQDARCGAKSFSERG